MDYAFLIFVVMGFCVIFRGWPSFITYNHYYGNTDLDLEDRKRCDTDCCKCKHD